MKAAGRYRFGPFELDVASGRLRRGRASLAISAKAAVLLRLLLKRAGDCVTIEDALDELTSTREIGAENVTQYISQLRAALGDSAREPEFIRTEFGRGYRFIAPVRQTDEDFDCLPTTELLQARYNLDRRRPQTVKLALEQFLQIIRSEPDNVEAHLGAAEASATLGSHLFNAPHPAFERAARCLQLVSSLTAESARAQSVTALITLFSNYDVDVAQEYCERAFRFDPNDVLAIRVMSRICMVRKQWLQAAHHLHQELRVRPDSLDALVMLAVLEQYQHQPLNAVELLHRTCALDESYVQARYYLGTCLVEAGYPAEAIDALHAIPKSQRTATIITVFGRAFAAAGRHRVACAILDALNSRLDREYISPYLQATLHIALGDRKNAQRCMRHATLTRDPWSIFFDVEPRFEPVRL